MNIEGKNLAALFETQNRLPQESFSRLFVSKSNKSLIYRLN